MATIVLLHSALGLTSHVHAWAEALRDDGHVVETPDLFGGETFHDLQSGVAFADGHGGPPVFVEPAIAQIRDIDGPVVYAGFSLGACVAQLLALRRDDAAAAILVSGLISPEWLESEAWPPGVPGQLHRTESDEWCTTEEAEALIAASGGELVDFVYPGDAHLFAFEGWSEYDSEASHQLFEHVTDFLATLE
ncbi:dienelactone hydrolase family protein [Demequina sp. NBRC 110053]|uniref:dienelactone hydrolase family protein n=1 Tax=Demequina sp. NBRC 110053 TaxID=1570342 RepID=UPI000A071DAE|nr:dienelactone hydrolase family protein [Demequina sp. NBRC 110053]